MAILPVVMLVACGNAGDEGRLAQQLWSRLTAGQRDLAVQVDADALRAGLTPQVLAQVGGPVVIAQVPTRDAVAAMARVGQNNGVDTYLTQDGISLSLRGGVVVGTRGLGFDLMTADVEEPLTALHGQAGRAERVHRYLDGENHIFARSFVCSYAATSGRQVTETCRSSVETFENAYNFDRSQNIRSSRQWVSPQIGYVLIELFENDG